MFNKRYFILWLFILFLCSFVHTETYGQDGSDYYRETIFGINFNTNGGLIGGIMVRHTREISPKKMFNFALEIANVKHPNEVRTPNYNTGNIYILGKKNYLVAFRPQVGFEFLLFTKGKEDGIQVDAIINGGPTIGFVKPYYIQYEKSPGIVEFVPYDEKLHDPATKGAGIVGSAGFFRGIENTSIAPGVHLKTGLSFEFGTFGNNVSGIETGVMVEAYPYKIDIVEISGSYPTYNRSFFSSVYINLYFGGRH